MLGLRDSFLRRFAGLVWFTLLLFMLNRRAVAAPHFSFEERPTASAVDTSILMIVFDEQCNARHVKERTLRSTFIHAAAHFLAGNSTQGHAILATPYTVRVDAQQEASYEAYTKTRIVLTFSGNASAESGEESDPVSCTVDDEMLHRVGVNILDLLQCPQLEANGLKAAFEREPCVHSVEFSQKIQIVGGMRQLAERRQPTLSVHPVLASSVPTASESSQNTVTPTPSSMSHLPSAQSSGNDTFDSYSTSTYTRQFADCFPFLNSYSNPTDRPPFFTLAHAFDPTSPSLRSPYTEGASSSSNALPHAYVNLTEHSQPPDYSPSAPSSVVPALCEQPVFQYWRDIAGFTAGTRFITRQSSTVVALVDTGVAFGHPRLHNSAWINTAEIPGNNVDDDKNGFVDDVNGFDFVHNSGSIQDDNGHGTHCAGIIAGERDDCTATEGVCGCIRIAALKFLGSEGTGFTTDALRALNYALQMKFPISNHSWGGPSYSPALNFAIYKAHKSGHLVIAAAGNNGMSIDACPFYPASLRLPNVIAVAASDADDCIADFSNTGVKTVHVAAPGVDILSTFPPNTYTVLSGTSSAAPMVTGLAAVLEAVSHGGNPGTIKEAILRGVDKVQSATGRLITGGRINAAKSIGWLLEYEGSSNRGNGDIVVMFATE